MAEKNLEQFFNILAFKCNKSASTVLRNWLRFN
jgi:hypothetical protein